MNSETLSDIAYIISALGFISTMIWFMLKSAQQKDDMTEGTFLGFFIALGFTGFFTLGFGIGASDVIANTGEQPVPLGVVISIISFVLFVVLSTYAIYRKTLNLNNNELFKKKNVELTSENNDALNSSIATRLNHKTRSKTSKEQVENRS